MHRYILDQNCVYDSYDWEYDSVAMKTEGNKLHTSYITQAQHYLILFLDRQETLACHM